MPTRDRAVDIAPGVAGTFVTATRPGVLFVHGWGGNRQQYLARAREVATLGCVCLAFDLRGHAASSGERDKVSRADNLRDVIAAYDELARLTSDIAVVGSSYGAYLGAILTLERPVRWLGLRAPALYPDDGWDTAKQQLHRDMDIDAFRRVVHGPDASRALRACRGFAGDVLIAESELDDTIPHPTIQSYQEACKHARSLTYRVIKGADHALTDPDVQHAYTAVLVRWLAEMFAKL